MTPKEALNVIWHDSYELKVEAYHVLQLLVLKSIPMKPIILNGWLVCNSCNQPVARDEKFCSECSQKLDWSL